MNPYASSYLSQWWRDIDKVLFFSFSILMILGLVLSFSATPPVATRINLAPFHFVKKQFFMLPLGLGIIFFLSNCSAKTCRMLCALGYLALLPILLLTLFSGAEVKGATRWISVAGFTLQPSEFIKPCLVILVAWVLSKRLQNPDFPSYIVASILLILPIFLIILQPDFGMTFIITLTFLVQIFLAGLPWIIILGLTGLSLMGVTGAYFFLPHVTKRVNQFLKIGTQDAQGDLYQIEKSLEAFKNGWLFGKGPGEGVAKKYLPDCHADFIFSVAGEEFGFFLCAIIILIFMTFFIRGVMLTKGASLFTSLSLIGICFQLLAQGFVNIASSLHLIPTKGMTLPLISYGGSSFLALSISIGLLMALSRYQNRFEEL